MLANEYKDFYTFDNGSGAQIDTATILNNKISIHRVGVVYQLNNNIFIGTSTYVNVLAEHFSNNTIGSLIYCNIIGSSFYYNTIGNEFVYNTLGVCFFYNTFGERFQNQDISQYVTSGSNLLRHNEFGNGIAVTKNWGTARSAILLSDQTVKWAATGATATVAFSYQDTAGTVITDAIPA